MADKFKKKRIVTEHNRQVKGEAELSPDKLNEKLMKSRRDFKLFYAGLPFLTG